MKGLKITKKVHIEVSMTAEDWELYCSQPESKHAAIALNRCFEECVNNAGCDKKETQKRMMEIMRDWRDLGTMDSEPMFQLQRMLSEVF